MFGSTLSTFHGVVRTITPTMFFTEECGSRSELMFVEEWNKPSTSVVDAMNAKLPYYR